MTVATGQKQVRDSYRGSLRKSYVHSTHFTIQKLRTWTFQLFPRDPQNKTSTSEVVTDNTNMLSNLDCEDLFQIPILDTALSLCTVDDRVIRSPLSPLPIKDDAGTQTAFAPNNRGALSKAQIPTSTENSNPLLLPARDIRTLKTPAGASSETSSSRRAHNFHVGLLIHEENRRAKSRSSRANDARFYTVKSYPLARLPSAELWDTLLQ